VALERELKRKTDSTAATAAAAKAVDKQAKSDKTLRTTERERREKVEAGTRKPCSRCQLVTYALPHETIVH
jgi:hypothetical protein